MSRKRLSIGVATNTMDKVVVALVQFMSIPILVDGWGLNLFGIWSMMITIPTFLVLTDFGIVNSAVARMTRQVARDAWDEARSTLHTAWTVCVTLIAIFLTAIAAVVWTLPEGSLSTTANFTTDDARATITMLLAYGLLTILFRLNTAALRSTMRYSLAVVLGTGSYAIENFTVMALVFLGYGPLVAAAAMLVLRTLMIIALLVISARLTPRLKSGFGASSMSTWKELWRPALAASALGFGQVGYLQGSVLVLGVIAGPASVPAFIAVRTLSRLGVQMSTLVSLPFSQEFANAMGRHDRIRAGRLFGIVLILAVVTSIAMGLGFALFVQPFIAFWTRDAIHASMPLIILMGISSAASILWNPLANFILSVNEQRSYSYANVVASVLGVIAIYLLAQGYGATAAGFSFAFVDLVTLVAVLWYIGRQWIPSTEFKAGIVRSGKELTKPGALLCSLR